VESVFAIAIATAAGWYWDRYFDHAPFGTIAGATIGFGAFVLRLIRLGSAMNPSPDGDPSKLSQENAPRNDRGDGPT
jgi:F0F1-type ATP synthase assembly protein I